MPVKYAKERKSVAKVANPLPTKAQQERESKHVPTKSETRRNIKALSADKMGPYLKRRDKEIKESKDLKIKGSTYYGAAMVHGADVARSNKAAKGTFLERKKK